MRKLKESGKKAVIVIQLVEESREVPNEQIKKEIFEELSKGLSKIPWMKKVESIEVRD
ncbi:MAG: hypothetical protein ACE5HX_19005 [bacterium]